MARIQELMTGNITEVVWSASFNTMQHEADQCPYSVVFEGPWGFEPVIGAHTVREARGTARTFSKAHPETEAYEIGMSGANGEWQRVEQCDLIPPSDDDRALQGLGWPNASEAGA